MTPFDPTTDDELARVSSAGNAVGEFEDALKRLRLLKNLSKRQVRDSSILDSIYVHSIETVESRLRLLAEMSLPISRKPRQVIRNMQDLLEALTRLLLNFEAKKDPAASPTPADGLSPLTLWRMLHILSRHLFISSLTAAPPQTGIWKQLHQMYDIARQQGIAQTIPEGAECSIKDEYFAAVLLGCAQPTSFTAREVYFLGKYIERFCEQVDVDIDDLPENQTPFWIDPESDTPAIPYSRKPPAPETSVLDFSCHRLVSLLESQLLALETGTPPKWINLPSFSATAAGLGVMQRLIRYWGKPETRRFPRRSQNYRGELCLGFDSLRHLYKKDQEMVETSAWMVINESPNGYAVMHLSGRTPAVRAGDVVALRTESESGNDWQLCIIRWALSENQEHMELGLYILTARAYAADVVLTAQAEVNTCHRPALVLPVAPRLRQHEALVVPTGTLAGSTKNLVLIIERDNIEIREVSHVQCDERNSLIELYAMTSTWN
ncbi:MAG: hypothetical protein LBI62_04805 [Candidatus Accumulibacter sp.]|jgi:hypothetical protein|nr:hypothetical protein [Accumulibacter sp.]